MIFIDSNILIDVLSNDPAWKPWSEAQLDAAVDRGRLLIDVIVVSELSRGFASLAELIDTVDQMFLEIEPLDVGVSFEAGHRFLQYRRDRTAGPPARLARFLHRRACAYARDTLAHARPTPVSPLLSRIHSHYPRDRP